MTRWKIARNRAKKQIKSLSDESIDRKNLPKDVLFTWERLTPEELAKETEQEKNKRVEQVKKCYYFCQTDKERTCSNCNEINQTPLVLCSSRCGYNICLDCYVSNFVNNHGLIQCYGCWTVIGEIWEHDRLALGIEEIITKYFKQWGIPLPTDNFIVNYIECATSEKDTKS